MKVDKNHNYKKITHFFKFILITLYTSNLSYSATISLNFANKVLEQSNNKGDKVSVYKHKLSYKENNTESKHVMFNDFEETDIKIINKIALISNGNFILTGLDTYPILDNGNFTLDGKDNYNVKQKFGIPNNSGNFLMILRGFFISSNVKKISIIGNNIFKPILIINCDLIGSYFYLTKIKCLNIPFIKLYPNNVKNCFNNNFEDYVNISEIHDIESLRYTVFQFNVPVKIKGKEYNGNKKIVVKGTKITPHCKMVWN